MFKLFSSGKKYFTGIDFGTSAVKIVEFSYQEGKILLENYGWVETGPSLTAKEGDMVGVSFDQKLKTFFEGLVKKMDLKGRSVFVSIPGSKGLTTLIELPEMKSEDLERAIQFEAKKYIPVPLEEIALSWEIVGSSSAKKKLIMLVAAPRKEVEKYENLIRQSGLNMEVLELETFSLVRSLIGSDLSTFLIVDIGSRATNILLVDEGVIRVTRNVDVGGYDITLTIAESMGVSKNRAETLKKEKENLLSGKEISLVIPSVELIINEISRIVEAYKSKNSQTKINSVILSGGSAKIKGVADFFTQKIGIKTVLGNPWKKIEVNSKVDALVRNKIGTSFSVAIGLALRGIENYERK